jgi:hypothetical protein
MVFEGKENQRRKEGEFRETKQGKKKLCYIVHGGEKPKRQTGIRK